MKTGTFEERREERWKKLPAVTLDAGERTLVVKDWEAFQFRYGPDLNVVGEFTSGRLSNDGGVVASTDRFQQVVGIDRDAQILARLQR